jgi:hypothetical protein
VRAAGSTPPATAILNTPILNTPSKLLLLAGGSSASSREELHGRGVRWTGARGSRVPGAAGVALFTAIMCVINFHVQPASDEAIDAP